MNSTQKGLMWFMSVPINSGLLTVTLRLFQVKFLKVASRLFTAAVPSFSNYDKAQKCHPYGISVILTVSF